MCTPESMDSEELAEASVAAPESVSESLFVPAESSVPVPQNSIGTPWSEIENKALSDPSQALDYLTYIKDEDPEMWPQALLQCLRAARKAAAKEKA